MIKKILLTILALVILLVVVLVVKTLSFKAPEYAAPFEQVSINANPQELAGAIPFETISHKAGMIDHAAFEGLQAYADSLFPLTDSLLTRTTLNKHAQIYYWKGKNPALKPIIITAHLDVVPVEFASKNEWEVGPFSGEIKDNFIYGRGTLDDKGSFISILSAVNTLLSEGFTPERDIYLCFGHDEEVGGDLGAKAIVPYLKNKGVEAEFVLDEGGILTQDVVPGITKQVALIGTSEKGYMSIDLNVNVEGGHSSMPVKETAITKLVNALQRLEDNPMPNRFCDPLEGFIQSVGPNLPFTQKLAFANKWLLSPLIFSVYEKSGSGAALVHTTQAITILRAGIKDNVIPSKALAIINYRLLPGDEPDEILARAKRIVNDTMVKITIHEAFSSPASPVSDYKHANFTYLQRSINSVFPDALVSPYLVLGATDGRYYYALTDRVYRFMPILMHPQDIPRLHGINERISVEDYQKAVKFYYSLLSNLSKLN